MHHLKSLLPLGLPLSQRSNGKTIVHKDDKQFNIQNKVYEQIKSDNSLHFAEALDNGNLQLIAYNSIPITNWISNPIR